MYWDRLSFLLRIVKKSVTQDSSNFRHQPPAISNAFSQICKNCGFENVVFIIISCFQNKVLQYIYIIKKIISYEAFLNGVGI